MGVAPQRLLLYNYTIFALYLKVLRLGEQLNFTSMYTTRHSWIRILLVQLFSEILIISGLVDYTRQKPLTR